MSRGCNCPSASFRFIYARLQRPGTGKGRSLPADGLILDLEDAVAPDAKDVARDQIVAALAEGGYGKREIQIRTNGLNTPWGYADIVAAAKTSADAILLPKVESADTVRQVATIMEAQGAHADMRIWHDGNAACDA